MSPRLSSAQAGHLDSLRTVLTTQQMPDSQRIALLLELAGEYTFNNIDSVKAIIQECLLLADKQNNYARTGDAYATLGTGYYRRDQYDSALHYFEVAESYYQKDSSAERDANIAANRMSMGTALLQQGYHQTALHAYLAAIAPLEKLKDYNNLVTAFANIGLVYNDLKQFDKALMYHEKALALSVTPSSNASREKTAQVQMLVAFDHINLHQFDRADAALQKADSIIRLEPSDYLCAIFYSMEGRYYEALRSLPRAVEAFEAALHYAVKSGQPFQEANDRLRLGKIYLEQAAYDKGVANLLKSLAVSRKIGDKIRERTALEYLSDAYAKTGNNAEAVRYYRQYFLLSDSLNEADNKKKINEIENRYQNKQKADSILVLQKNAQLQRLALHKKESQNLFIIAAALLLALIGLLVYRNLRHKHRLLKQSEEINNQRILDLERERQLVAAQSLMKGQEEERSRLAKDLHDGVGGLLSGVKLSLATMRGNMFLSEENAGAIGAIINQLDGSISELRRVSHNMMPEALITYGLTEALENYCENINQSGQARIRLQIYGMEQRMDQDTEIILYRIVQELLNNIIKHAAASQVLIQLVREGERFSLTAEDDGKGFDMHAEGFRRGAGLQNIQARVAYLNGTVDIRTAPGEGTSVTIEGLVR